MAIWKEQAPPKKDTEILPPKKDTVSTPTPSFLDPTRPSSYAPSVPTADVELPAPNTPRRAAAVHEAESVIGPNLTIEGKIEGTGDVRIAGRFKGNVQVEGNLTIEAGAKLTGGVHAEVVVVGGELEGNIDGASKVELRETGVLMGDLKAGSLVVAAGSRMRGQVEFGWGDKKAPAPKTLVEAGAGA